MRFVTGRCFILKKQNDESFGEAVSERAAKQTVADAGRLLLRERLVARTWGNVSCRTGAQSFVITPSGLGYDQMTGDDVVSYDMAEETWTGPREPSSEKGVHTAAYRRFPDAGAVIHTHQTYASALGLAGFGGLSPSENEMSELGGIALAKYGLPGSERLTENVAEAMGQNAHIVLMANHGALIVGRDMDEAFRRAALLEDISLS
ncbi:MAG: class II aldolase/adducin family protein [Clostridia bacterium]|nr:class II aldolase/adducin family protein [Clostridia bacterium]